ncbi:MAG TPA: DUF4189 domain-containing protein [Roseococcus sp.]|nr:DUF4189 domain-containing protein [Roseococcus sp.]
MMRRRRLVPLWLLGLLGLWLGLPVVAQAQTGNPTHDALSARGEQERRGLFLQGLRGTGNACNNIALLYPAGLDAQRSAYWDVRCTEGTSYRTRIPAERFAQPSFLRCGASAPAPQGGPCFRPVAAGAGAQGHAAQTAQSCQAACARQPQAAQNQCVQRCVGGAGVRAGAQTADTLPPGSRFGVFYHTENPLAAFGFANGGTDRLAVNMQAVRACQAMAGPVQCKFQGELVNRCGALAFAISRHPRALAMTSDISTQVLNLAATGEGETRQAAEEDALEACRRAEGPGVQCRIVAAGC